MKNLVLCAALAVGIVGGMTVLAAESTDKDSSNAGMYVKNSVITTKVKAKLAAKHMATLTDVKVDTDKNGVVYLTGKAPTKDASDVAELVAKDTDGVTSVHNKIVVQE